MLESQPQNPKFGSYNSFAVLIICLSHITGQFNLEIVNFEAYCKF